MSDTEQHNWFEKLSHFLSREPHSQAQLIEILRDAHHRELIDRDALQMIEGVLAVSDKKVRDVMIPRPQMVVVEADAQPIEILPMIIQSQHSRFPVIEDNRDKVLGILLAKDLLPFAEKINAVRPTIRTLIRPATFIPESKPLDVLLKEFRANRNHMAIVVDEYGSVAGLVTIEDVLEEIVGDINDEYDIDEKESSIKEIEKNSYAVNALTSIREFNHYFKTNLSDADCDTIGGYVVQQFGHLPKRNESVQLPGFEAVVIKATRRGIQQLQFKKK
ncbi:MAG: hypothetical protein ACD_42C00449G0003 [uncultured bacterium]|nr:MAG: hypothetical protein ACD_42C00449G0003 [uncultured bacterium]OGT33922.1 MAG: magnesium/cobalt efflux protein [Gammaproteobacteria bacterium RIFCSPHIGHO2_02_FULL_39_13]OGT50173.1 MAG: magnesium/cobalt efflux protein [Gammaproteobacteria bacterium RIFCSPHIGHO2_12_FULL_39_24]